MWWKKTKQRAFVEEKEKKKERRFKINYSWIVHHIPFLLFLFGLGILYIANGHYMVDNVRKTNKLQVKVQELHWEYLTRKSELMYRSKMSNVAEEVRPYGLRESTVPPIVIKEGENKNNN